MAWVGIRNAQARNFIRDRIQMGDGILFYHSSTAHPCVVGTASVVSEAFPDRTAWDPTSPFFDSKSDRTNPTWLAVDIRADMTFARPVTLREIKQHPKLKGMMVVKPGTRLSIQPVDKADWDEIIALGMEEKPAP